MIQVIISAIIVIILLVMVIYAYNLFAAYLSGNWMSVDGSIVIIEYKGVLGNSEMVLANNNGDDTYNTLKKQGFMYICPLSVFGFKSFVAKFAGFKLDIDIVAGTLTIIRRSDKKNYGTYYRNAVA
jgi:hypothetical protein